MLLIQEPKFKWICRAKPRLKEEGCFWEGAEATLMWRLVEWSVTSSRNRKSALQRVYSACNNLGRFCTFGDELDFLQVHHRFLAKTTFECVMTEDNSLLMQNFKPGPVLPKRVRSRRQVLWPKHQSRWVAGTKDNRLLYQANKSRSHLGGVVAFQIIASWVELLQMINHQTRNVASLHL